MLLSTRQRWDSCFLFVPREWFVLFLISYFALHLYRAVVWGVVSVLLTLHYNKSGYGCLQVLLHSIRILRREWVILMPYQRLPEAKKELSGSCPGFSIQTVALHWVTSLFSLKRLHLLPSRNTHGWFVDICCDRLSSFSKINLEWHNKETGG